MDGTNGGNDGEGGGDKTRREIEGFDMEAMLNRLRRRSRGGKGGEGGGAWWWPHRWSWRWEKRGRGSRRRCIDDNYEETSMVYM